MPQSNQLNLFRAEYEREMENWLHRRFGYLCVAYLVLESFVLVMTIAAQFRGNEETARLVSLFFARTVQEIATLAVLVYFYRLRHRLASREQNVAAASRMILALGAISMLGNLAHRSLATEFPVDMLGVLLFWHLTASLFLPWTPRESVRPIVPLIIVWNILLLLTSFRSDPTLTVLRVVFSPAVCLPGLAISAYRIRRHREQFQMAQIGRHFNLLRHELSQARQIHESMFPPEHDDGHVAFRFSYEPMRDLGGDFVHLRVRGSGIVDTILLDVTGHGLAAAMTVNRVYGEIERLYGETPRIAPGEMLAQLNRYFDLTLARHNIFATAVFMRMDPYACTLTYASAGHPPLLIRRGNGTIDEFGSTAIMLGAVPPGEFEADEVVCDMEPGDTAVAYTDGAFEPRNRDGRQFGLDGLRSALQRTPAPRDWPQFLASLVDRHRAGPSDDDVLIASLAIDSPRRSPAARSEEREAVGV